MKSGIRMLKGTILSIYEHARRLINHARSMEGRLPFVHVVTGGGPGIMERKPQARSEVNPWV